MATWPPPVSHLLTDRLVLDRPVASDFDPIAELLGNARVAATLGGVRDRTAAREFFDRQMGHWPAFGFGLWIARDRATGAFVGRGGPRLVVLEGRAEAEVAYALMPEFWGRGLATELARKSVRVAFEILGLTDLVCFTLPTNRASRRVMEKVGFRHERDGQFMGVGQAIYRLRRGGGVEVAP
jgi:RimJ/RimL family protein N-acetyltransferase